MKRWRDRTSLDVQLRQVRGFRAVLWEQLRLKTRRALELLIVTKFEQPPI